jgi:hypothetical protein
LYYDAERLKVQLKKAGFEIREPNKVINPIYRGFEFDIVGRSFNIISVTSNIEYHKWYVATYTMRDKPEYKDREQRLSEFQKIAHNSPPRKRYSLSPFDVTD